MPYCVRPEQIREIDDYCTKALGMPRSKLMWKAAEAVAEAIEARLSPGARVLFLCGVGGNGGDGYGAAAILAARGFDAMAINVFDREPTDAAARDCLCACKEESRVLTVREYFGERIDADSLAGCDAVVEAIFGTGFTGDVPERVAELIYAVNSLDGVMRIALDSPVGIDADTGEVHNVALRADLTLAVSFYKTGQLSYPAREYCGELVLLSIGQDEEKIAEEFELTAYSPDAQFVAKTLANRHKNAHKGSFGKLLVIAGSKRYRGAATLATSAALHVGAGLVTLASEEAVINANASRQPEVVYLPVPPLSDCSNDDIKAILDAANESTAILIGCGSTVSKGLLNLLTQLLESCGAPLIIDADGLNALATAGCPIKMIAEAKRSVIITPHPAEFARLTKKSVAEVQQRRLREAKNFASIVGCVCVLKGASTITASPYGTAVNLSGSPALAKAGSGDVLAGAIAGICAQGIDPSRASACAVYLHGRAGDALEKEYSEYGVMPSLLPAAISREIRKCKAQLC